jgi:hypothetical protein
MLAFKRVEFVSDRMLHTVRRSHWYDIVPNVDALTEGKTGGGKESFCEEPEWVVNTFPKYHMKILL